MGNEEMKLKAQLAFKLLEVTNEVGYIEKNGHNEFNNYDYVKELDVLNKMRQVMYKHKVFIMPSNSELKTNIYENKDGNTKF